MRPRRGLQGVFWCS
uniref:Uncharacterized protein n=1 Tax=Rhizophora mucronata TaxID=61149 RepID=A0A2P2PPX5_RHIMU